MVADLTCPFCGGPADGYSVDHVAEALFAQVAEDFDKAHDTMLVFQDFVDANFDDISEEAKGRMAEQATAMANNLESFYDAEPE